MDGTYALNYIRYFMLRSLALLSRVTRPLVTRKWICWSPKSVADPEKGREERKRKRRKKTASRKGKKKTTLGKRWRKREREREREYRETESNHHGYSCKSTRRVFCFKEEEKKGKKTFSLFLVVFHFQLSFLLSALNVISFVPCRALRS